MGTSRKIAAADPDDPEIGGDEIIEDDDDCMILTWYEHVACGACLQLVDIKCAICTKTKEEPAQKQESKKRNIINLSEETDSDDDFVLKRV